MESQSCNVNVERNCSEAHSLEPVRRGKTVRNRYVKWTKESGLTASACLNDAAMFDHSQFAFDANHSLISICAKSIPFTPLSAPNMISFEAHSQVYGIFHVNRSERTGFAQCEHMCVPVCNIATAAEWMSGAIN